MEFGIGFITGIGLVSGTYTIKNGNKKIGVIQLVLTIISLIMIILFCAQKERFVFGGSDYEFLVQTATIDKMYEAWIILLLSIISIVLIIINVVNIIKNYKLK